MLWYSALGWGAFGGAAVEVMDFYRASKEANNTRFTGWQIFVLGFAIILRIAVGGGLAVALASGDQICAATGAIAVGAAAPIILAKLVKGAPRL